MPALVEAQTLPDWPGVTGYQITSSSRDDVQTAIASIVDRVGELGGEAAFDGPQRSYSVQDGLKCWRAHGYVRQLTPTAQACADLRAWQRERAAR